ncbi:DUF1294 domain-containing protein [Wenzhouxiangella sp. XN79A]|uniref:DUF1294 domain-containing protein n=1 Tax=Wenzhouxiangella sp. XN79A TaxID=2724193 RepID=UPI00144A9FB8|nr:cold shock and DUF1294 domain-containing protein [Wenzhouxiangella sp. XN79A]NKI34733.1 DUF1294 domain-containing protein [Wenzhouxiangella sp. XN79A]
MREQGKVVEWDDARGFGFVKPHSDGPRAFLHISALASGSRRPSKDDLVTYSLERDSKGRWQAHGVRYVGRPPRKTKGSRSARISPLDLCLLLVFGAVLFAAVAEGALQIAVPLVVVLMSLVTFIAYGLDKGASQRGAWRTSEATLHLLALFGGWPGALIAQRRFRHKTRKGDFQAVFWTTVVLNMLLLIGLAYWF